MFSVSEIVIQGLPARRAPEATELQCTAWTDCRSVMASARYQSMARQIDHRCGHLRIRRVRRPEHPLQPFQPARPRQLKQQDSASFEYLRSRPRRSLDKRIDRRHHRTSHVIVRFTYAPGRGFIKRERQVPAHCSQHRRPLQMNGDRIICI